MKINAVKCPSCKDLLYSRARHDFRWCSCESVAVDGGFDYGKVSFKAEYPESVEIIVEANKEELLEDWCSGANKYGLIKNA